jgi:RNA polymerase sigma-70 factor, ECF subfamily
VQETFVKAWRRLDQLEDGVTFGAWLHRIAGNCALDLLRRRSRHPEASLQDEVEDGPRFEAVSGEPTPDRLVEGVEMRRRLEAAMARLSPLERTAFVLRHHDGLSIEEIGATLGSGPSTTKSSIFRAVQKLRRALRPALQVAR